MGYKNFRRGEKHYQDFKNEIDTSINIWSDFITKAIQEKYYSVISFDNLAIEQLEVQRLMSKEEWDEFYMGDDGNYTLYVDVVNQQFAKSSVSTQRYSLLDDMKDMFNIIKQSSCKEV